MEYIAWLLEKHTLPFLYQNPALPIEHPPLYYIIGALFIKSLSLVCSSLSAASLCEGLQYLTLFFVVGTMFLFYHMVKLFKMPFVYSMLAFVFIAFYPIFIFLSGSLNNDAALLFFGTLSVSLFMRYILSDRLRTLCLSAFFMAATLLVKSSAISLVMGGYLFLCIAWISRYYPFKKIVIVGVIYTLISLPLGLSWNIYNYFKWENTPSSSHLYREQLERETGYHPILHSAISKGSQNISAYSYLDRLLITIEPHKYPFIRTRKPYEYNIWNSLIKSTLFDEYSLFSEQSDSFLHKWGWRISLILWYLNCSFFIFFIWSFVCSKKDPLLLYLKSVVFSLLISFIAWCFVNPCWSAALVRYIPWLLLAMALVNFKYAESLSKSYPRAQKVILTLVTSYVSVFSVLSNLLFIFFFCVSR